MLIATVLVVHACKTCNSTGGYLANEMYKIELTAQFSGLNSLVRAFATKPNFPVCENQKIRTQNRKYLPSSKGVSHDGFPGTRHARNVRNQISVAGATHRHPSFH
jgi:hypothetical protein